ncbi:MAG: LptA/OstA family protein [Gammaproteobacteria bacterium]|jgi:lipopolysaccharide transport protein LptA
MSRYALHARRFCVLALFAACALGQETQNSGYEAVCESASGNARSDETICVGVRITDGTNVISAGLAATNKYDFDGSLWRLTDDVRLAFDTTEILADEALFEFEANELVLGELSGNPVVMSDYIAERATEVSGTAESISYDSRNGTVRLLGQATLVMGANEYMGCDWIYDLNEKTFNAGSTDGCSGVLLRLTPPEEPEEQEAESLTP